MNINLFDPVARAKAAVARLDKERQTLLSKRQIAKGEYSVALAVHLHDPDAGTQKAVEKTARALDAIDVEIKRTGEVHEIAKAGVAQAENGQAAKSANDNLERTRAILAERDKRVANLQRHLGCAAMEILACEDLASQARNVDPTRYPSRLNSGGRFHGINFVRDCLLEIVRAAIGKTAPESAKVLIGSAQTSADERLRKHVEMILEIPIVAPKLISLAELAANDHGAILQARGADTSRAA